MNKQISTGVGMTVVIAVAIIAGVVVWFGKGQPVQTQLQLTQNAQMNSLKGVAGNQNVSQNKNQMQPQINPVSSQHITVSANLMFDGCGKKDKYSKLPWWNSFISQVGKINYVSPNHIESQLQSVRNNDYLNPNKIDYDISSLCEEDNFKDYDICGNDVNRKISITDFDEGEGCLSKDGSLFIAVFPGMYMDGGNHIFRYSTKDNILEEASKVNEEKGEEWFNPPYEFRGRTGNIVKMFGENGDAGCGAKSDYEYDFLKNEIKVTKTCTSCDMEKEKCQTFKQSIKL
jgi:hypothetical protein